MLTIESAREPSYPEEPSFKLQFFVCHGAPFAQCISPISLFSHLHLPCFPSWLYMTISDWRFTTWNINFWWLSPHVFSILYIKTPQCADDTLTYIYVYHNTYIYTHIFIYLNLYMISPSAIPTPHVEAKMCLGARKAEAKSLYDDRPDVKEEVPKVEVHLFLLGDGCW